jgi:hypothetical protein
MSGHRVLWDGRLGQLWLTKDLTWTSDEEYAAVYPTRSAAITARNNFSFRDRPTMRPVAVRTVKDRLANDG